jgi:hypothetical protein
MVRSVITISSRLLSALTRPPAVSAGIGGKRTPTVIERLDALADHPIAVITAGMLWMTAEFVGAAGLWVMYR